MLPWFVDVALVLVSDHFTAATMDAQLAPLTIRIIVAIVAASDSWLLFIAYYY